MRVHSTFQMSHIKPVKESSLVPASRPLPTLLFDGGPVYTVKRLMAVRRRGRGIQYLVDWKGYGLEERSRVPAKMQMQKMEAQVSLSQTAKESLWFEEMFLIWK